MDDITQNKKNTTVLDSLSSWYNFWMYLKEKIRHPGIQKHSKNIGWMFFARIASMTISFISTIYIARHLGPTNYGQLSYAVSFVGLFSFIAALGIDQVLYRDLIKYPDKRNEYIGSALILRMISSIITIILCVSVAVLFSQRDVSLLLIFIVSLSFIFNTFQLVGYEFQAEVNQKYPSILAFTVVLILNVLKILVIVFNKGVIYLAFVVLLEPMLYAVGYIYFRIKVYGTIKYWRFDKQIAISILKDSTPLIFSAAFVAIYARIDQVMLKYMADAKSVGLYNSAVSISEVWYFIPQIIIQGVFPAVMNAKKMSEELYYKRIQKLFLIILLVTLAPVILTTLLSNYFISLIFGAGFIGAAFVLQIYVWSNVGGMLNATIQQVLIAENLTKIISATTFLGMATNVILNIFLIPRYGMAGAAFASLVSYLVPFLSLILFRPSRKIVLNIFRNNA